MLPQPNRDRLVAAIAQHCAALGYVDGPNWNPMLPVDPVAAFAMACLLTRSGLFDHVVAVAPEGHVYGYFFERLGVPVLSVFVEYPPQGVILGESIETVRGGRVLLLEDDLVSGTTLRQVVAALGAFAPQSLWLYLGRRKEDQFLDNTPPEIRGVFLAEDCLDPAARAAAERELLALLGHDGSANEQPATDN
jgi:hypothetical protein